MDLVWDVRLAVKSLGVVAFPDYFCIKKSCILLRSEFVCRTKLHQ